MSVQLTILGSGSNGNCSYLECGETRLLIDAGFSGRQIRQRLSLIGRVPEALTGILITHEHGDHIAGLAALGASSNGSSAATDPYSMPLQRKPWKRC